MSGFLRSLPHHIPFRAASAAQFPDERTAVGTFLVSSADELGEAQPLSQLMIFEAMAQIGGGIVFRTQHHPAFLSAIDRAELSAPFQAGDRVTIRVTFDSEFGGIRRFSGTAERDGVEIARARFYLSSSEEKATDADA